MDAGPRNGSVVLLRRAQLGHSNPARIRRAHQGQCGPHRDRVHIIDKRSLEIVRTLQPAPGKTAAHVEFDRSGEHALLSIWDLDGAVIVYDADTFEEVKRLPMVKPSGKYNVHNKITRSAGTSH